MNRRQIINKILHDHIDVNKYEDYTNYKKLITAIEGWHESEIEKLSVPIVNQRSELFDLLKWMQNDPFFNIDDVDEILDDYYFYKSNCG